jgi:hypothetical protein
MDAIFSIKDGTRRNQKIMIRGGFLKFYFAIGASVLTFYLDAGADFCHTGDRTAVLSYLSTQSLPDKAYSDAVRLAACLAVAGSLYATVAVAEGGNVPVPPVFPSFAGHAA